MFYKTVAFTGDSIVGGALGLSAAFDCRIITLLAAVPCGMAADAYVGEQTDKGMEFLKEIRVLN